MSIDGTSKTWWGRCWWLLTTIATNGGSLNMDYGHQAGVWDRVVEPGMRSCCSRNIGLSQAQQAQSETHALVVCAFSTVAATEGMQ
jgi:hypothetical protein